MRIFILLLIVIPALEIAVLLLSGKTIGVLPTFSIIILTGVVGAYLAKKQGLETMRRAQQRLHAGEIPGESIIDGICIFAGGLLLLTPGFITDTLGFLLLIPQIRRVFKRFLKQMFKRRIDRGNIKIIR